MGGTGEGGTGEGRGREISIDASDPVYLTSQSVIGFSIAESVLQSSGAVSETESRWPSWAPVPNKPTVSVDVTEATLQPTNQCSELRSCVNVSRRGGRLGLPIPNN